MTIQRKSTGALYVLPMLIACSSAIIAAIRAGEADEQPAVEKGQSQEYTTETIRGHFVWMAEAQERLFGVRSVEEAKENVLAIETNDGQLVPLAEDVRGHGFRADERLRKLQDCEVVVRRFHKSPLAQVLQLYSYEEGVKYEIDYYCDVCSIVMYELKACECCQGETQLRKQPVK